MKNKEQIWATGRRKTSVAQVRLIPKGEGKVTVNAPAGSTVSTGS